VHLIKIGNSKGIQIPKSIFKPIPNPRKGWEEACKKMHKAT